MQDSPNSHILEQPHDAVVHVPRLVAVEKRRSRIVGDDVHVDRTEAGDNNRVLHDTCSRPPIHAHELELVAMQMHWMRIVRFVPEREAVAAAGVDWEWRALVVLRAVDCPAIESMRAAIDLA